MRISEAEMQQRAGAIRWLLTDVDGVLTDGRIHCHADGSQSLAFDVKDGMALVLAQRAGLGVGLLSGRDVPVVRDRATQLGIETLMLGITDKAARFEQFLSEQQLESAQIAYLGDDLPDLPVLRDCGLSFCPRDAAPEVRHAVHTVIDRNGGHGVVRQAVEMLLKARGEWGGILRALGG